MSLSRRTKALLCGSLTVVICLCVLFAWSRRERELRRGELDRDTRVMARQSAGRKQQALQQHLISVHQLAKFMATDADVTEEEFYDLAGGTIKMTPLCLRIVAVDASLRVRWVYPPGPNGDLVGFDVRTNPEGYRTQLAARTTGEVVLSSPLQLVGGAQGFILVAPIVRKGAYLGSVVCAFRSADFFRSPVLQESAGRYEERVFDGTIQVFTSTKAEWAPSDFPEVTETFNMGGRDWRVQARPRPEVVRARLNAGAPTFWALSIFLSLLLGGAAGAVMLQTSDAFMRLRSQGAALKETRARLDGAMQQLLQAEKMTALGELVAGVAHEVNNPLASIMGYTQLALTRDPSPEVRRFLENAFSETERASRIVRNLLAFARKQPPEKKYLGLNGIIEKTVELKAYHFRTGQIDLQKDLDPGLPMTMVDFHQMQQVLINLLNNAEQALQETGRGGRILVATRGAGERIEIRVTDNGPGIPAEIQNRVFEPFFTTKKEGKGTGLGLSLCYGIIQEHGGSLRLESRAGQGTTFIIELPVLGENQEPAAESSSAEPPGSPGRLRVLVVDDERSVQTVLVEVLSAMGHRADTASDVPEALRKIEECGHDLIITDMRMPHGTGKDIYRAVTRKSPGLARRVIFTTGDGASPETQQLLRETGNEILPKPWSIQEIEAAINRALSN